MPMQCPTCRTIRLKSYQDKKNSFVVNHCPECFGIWFDPGQIREFVKNKHLMDRFIFPEIEMVNEYSISTSARICPRCQVTMEEKLISNATANICGQCKGIWLDFGEARRILGNREQENGFEKMLASEEEIVEEAASEEENRSDEQKPIDLLERLICFLQSLKKRMK